MEFRFLGPLVVIDRGQPLELGAPRTRAVLAILLVLFGGSVWFFVWMARTEGGVTAVLAALPVLGFGSGLIMYVRAPSRQSVVLRTFHLYSMMSEHLSSATDTVRKLLPVYR